MIAPNLLTPDTVILDGEVYRSDWEGSPRFYWVRLYPHDPREAVHYPHLYIPRVKVYVQLEGDPSAWRELICDDDSGEINDAVHDCVGEIESMMSDQWDREQEEMRHDCLTNYERQFGY